MGLKLLTIIPLYVISYILLVQEFIVVKTIELDAILGFTPQSSIITVYETKDNKVIGIILLMITIALTYILFIKKGE